MAMVGEYEDKLLKVDGRWLFSERNVRIDGKAP